jgi:hypothetical protein
MAYTTFDEPHVIEINLGKGSRYTVHDIYAMDLRENRVTCFQRGAFVLELQAYNLIDTTTATSDEGVSVYCVPQSQWHRGDV